MSRYTTETLLRRIRRRAFLPPAGGGFTDADLMEMADEALDAYLVPLLLRTREEWLVSSTTYTIEAGKADYAVPSSAIGGKTRLVQLQDVPSGLLLPPLPRLEPEQVPRYYVSNAGGEPSCFILEDNAIRLYPVPDARAAAAYRLRVSYHRQPAALAPPSGYGVIVSRSPDTATLNVSAPGAIVPGVNVDIVSPEPPFNVLAANVNVDSVAGALIGFTDPLDISISGYLCLSGTSPFPQVPAVTHALIALYVAEGLLKATDPSAASACADERQRAEVGALTAVSPRTEGNPRVLPNGFAKWRGTRG